MHECVNIITKPAVGAKLQFFFFEFLDFFCQKLLMGWFLYTSDTFCSSYEWQELVDTHEAGMMLQRAGWCKLQMLDMTQAQTVGANEGLSLMRIEAFPQLNPRSCFPAVEDIKKSGRDPRTRARERELGEFV